jgi:hypothetical protein
MCLFRGFGKGLLIRSRRNLDIPLRLHIRSVLRFVPGRITLKDVIVREGSDSEGEMSAAARTGGSKRLVKIRARENMPCQITNFLNLSPPIFTFCKFCESVQ